MHYLNWRVVFGGWRFDERRYFRSEYWSFIWSVVKLSGYRKCMGEISDGSSLWHLVRIKKWWGDTTKMVKTSIFFPSHRPLWLTLMVIITHVLICSDIDIFLLVLSLSFGSYMDFERLGFRYFCSMNCWSWYDRIRVLDI